MNVLTRLALIGTYVALIAAIGVPALIALIDAGHWPEPDLLRTGLTVVVPAMMLTVSVASRRHSLAWSVYWVWSLIFLALAPAYQLSRAALPWGAPLALDTVRAAQEVILVGYAVSIVVFVVASRRGRVTNEGRATVRNTQELRRIVTAMITIHAILCVVFIAVMGTALFSGRAAFSSRLVAAAELPAIGSVYFLSTAGAVILPAIGIVLRKSGVAVSPALIGLSATLSFIVTNPLIGSRFLTGSFLVAITAALIRPTLRRWLPAGIVLLFVTVFPTLDLLRGDGTGADQIELTDPATTLTSLDYDAFEMLYRAVSLNGEALSGLPGKAELLIAPLLRWVPLLSAGVQGDATGPVVAQSTGMGYTNVSMPLWGEAYFIGSWFGVVLGFALVGLLLAVTRRARSTLGTLIEIPAAALLFIVLRGSLYEVLGYMLLAVGIAWWVSVADARGKAGAEEFKAGAEEFKAGAEEFVDGGSQVGLYKSELVPGGLNVPRQVVSRIRPLRRLG